MMKAAKEGIELGAGEGKKPLVIAVTQLTSTSKEAMNEQQGIPGEVIDSVIRYGQSGQGSRSGRRGLLRP